MPTDPGLPVETPPFYTAKKLTPTMLRKPINLEEGSKIVPIHVTGLVTITSQTPYPIGFTPDFWFLVSRLTAGQLNLHIGTSRSATYITAVADRIRLPWRVEAVTVELLAATGGFDLYACYNLDGFDIH